MRNIYDCIDLKQFIKEQHLLKKISLLFLLLIVCSKGFSQAPQTASISTDMPEISPPSPTVAALMKFEEVPVSNYTGIPDINIPLFSVPSLSKDITVSVSLAYHPSGVAAKEVASYTGLGWNLMAGGTVSRTVRGIPDEFLQLGSSSNPGKIGLYYDNLGVSSNNYYNVLAMGPPTTTEQINMVSNFFWNATQKGINDTEHDLYQFSYMGHNGRFYIKRTVEGTLEVVRLDDDDTSKVILNYTYGLVYGLNRYTLNGFTIYNDKGYRFIFSAKEETTESNATREMNFAGAPNDNIADPAVYTSAFQLSAIYDNNDILLVEFLYGDLGESVTDNSSVTNYITPAELQQQIVAFVSSPTNGYIYGLLPKYVRTTKTRNVITKKISTINVLNEAHIEFTTVTGREDGNINSGGKLKTVTLKNWAGSVVKYFDLQYLYSNAPFTNGNPNYYVKRLLLNKVEEKSPTSTDIQTHQFFYKGKSVAADSYGMDYWGYFNKRPENYNGSYLKNDKYLCSVDILQKIKYPTGGCVIFNFGPNQYSSIGNVPLTDFKDNPDNYSEEIMTLTYSGLGLHCQSLNNLFISGVMESFKILTTVTPPQSNPQSIGFTGVKKNGQGISPDADGYYTFDSSSDYQLCFSNMEQASSATGTATVFYKVRHEPIKKYLYGGGLRINDIAYFDTDTPQYYYEFPEDIPPPSRERKYDYRSFLDSSMCSGALVFAKPVYEYNQKRNCFSKSLTNNFNVLNSLDYITFSDYNNLMSLRTKGADVGYQNVRVFETGNGYTKFTYKSPIDYPEDSYTVSPPFIPSKNYDYKRGLLTLEEVYDSSNRILKGTVYDYSFLEHEERTGIKNYPVDECPRSSEFPSFSMFLACYNEPDCFVGQEAYCNPFSYLGYASIFEAFGWAKLTSVTKRDYSYTVGQTLPNSIQTQELYTYNPLNKKPSSITRTNGISGEDIRTDFFYRTSSAAGHQNAIADIEQIDTYRNSLQTGTLKINYSNAGWGGNISILPQTIAKSKGTFIPTNVIRYNKYDAYSHPLELQQENGTKICYIWGYDKSQPVAKIENIAYAAIPPTIVSAIESANNDTALSAAFLQLRNSTALSQAMITTMLYRPLVGITSITDPKGYTTTYNYDSFGRLLNVKDADLKLLISNEYHYRSPQN